MEAAEYQKRLAAGLILRPAFFRFKWIVDAAERRLRAIQWKIRPKSPNWVFVKPPLDLVREFADLRSASEDQIRRFAKKWGILGICADHPGFPVHHAEGCLPIGKLDPGRQGAYISGLAEGVEPIRFWRRYAWLFHAVLEIGRALSQAKVGKHRYWYLLFPELRQNPSLIRISGPKDLVHARYRFSQHVAELYQLSGVQNVLDWNPENTRGKGQWLWRTRTTKPFNLIGILAIQAARILSGGGPTAVCSGCKQEYSSGSRRPKGGQANYCLSCRRDKLALRAADERRRARRRLAREMLLDGKTIEEIARSTGSRISTVKNLARKMLLKEKANGRA